MRDFVFIPKKANIVGLQVADLVANPITRHVLNPEEVNLAYNIVEKNIFHQGEKQLGLILLPKE